MKGLGSYLPLRTARLLADHGLTTVGQFCDWLGQGNMIHNMLDWRNFGHTQLTQVIDWYHGPDFPGPEVDRSGQSSRSDQVRTWRVVVLVRPCNLDLTRILVNAEVLLPLSVFDYAVGQHTYGIDSSQTVDLTADCNLVADSVLSVSDLA